MTSNTEINMIKEYEDELKALKYLQMMDNSDKVIDIVTNIRGVKDEPIIVKWFTKPKVKSI